MTGRQIELSIVGERNRMSDTNRRQRTRSRRIRTTGSGRNHEKPSLKEKGFMNIGLSPKEQKEYILSEVDKAIIEYAGNNPCSDEIGLQASNEYEGDLWFNFKIPGGIEYNICAGELLNFKKRVAKMSVIIKKSALKIDEKRISYGARTKQYKKLIKRPFPKITIDDIENALKEGCLRFNNFNPNHFLNWILSGSISKSVCNALKDKVIKCQIP